MRLTGHFAVTGWLHLERPATAGRASERPKASFKESGLGSLGSESDRTRAASGRYKAIPKVMAEWAGTATKRRNWSGVNEQPGKVTHLGRQNKCLTNDGRIVYAT